MLWRMNDQRRFTALAFGAAGIAGLCGCASESDIARRSKIDPGSPIAVAIAKAHAEPLPAPTFADIPKAPKDMRPASSWDQASTRLRTAQQQLTAETARPSEIGDPEALAQQLRATPGLATLAPPGPNNAAELEAFARELRERATPPPPPK